MANQGDGLGSSPEEVPPLVDERGLVPRQRSRGALVRAGELAVSGDPRPRFVKDQRPDDAVAQMEPPAPWRDAGWSVSSDATGGDR